jgi:CRISPR/Cas system CSM-associated protein Csm3 (group 7 of RAMP superfamily)
VTFTLQARGALFSNDALSAAESGFDHAPLMVAHSDWQRPVLPGASLRGVLRAQAERIARTLATHAALQQKKETPEKYFQSICPACYPMAQGRRDDQNKHVPVLMESCDSLLRYKGDDDDAGGYDGNRFIEEEQLCLACRLFGSTRRGSRLIVEDAPFIGSIPHYKMLDFLAIDRFTGGGADHLKFDALVLWKPSFCVRLFLDNPQPWELGWLTLVLRDLRDGMLSVGYGVAKGFGQVTIADDWQVTLGLLDPETDFLLGTAETAEATQAKQRLITTGTRDSSVYTELFYTAAYQQDWLTVTRQWVQSFVDNAQGSGGRSQSMPLPHDSYFGTDNLTTLYPALSQENTL